MTEGLLNEIGESNLVRLERAKRVNTQELGVVRGNLLVEVQSCLGAVGKRFIVFLEDGDRSIIADSNLSVEIGRYTRSRNTYQDVSIAIVRINLLC